MITVAELAKELDVSVQTIYRTLNSVKHTENICLTEKINKIVHFTPKGEEIIRERLTHVKQTLNDVKQLNAYVKAENDEVLFLREQIKGLNMQNKELTDQLADLANKLAELTRNSQVLLKSEQERNTLLFPADESANKSNDPNNGETETEVKQRKSFWQKLWKK